MCKYSERLIAWMDGELAENEAAKVEQHVRACAACGGERIKAAQARAGTAPHFEPSTTEPAPPGTPVQLPHLGASV